MPDTSSAARDLPAACDGVLGGDGEAAGQLRHQAALARFGELALTSDSLDTVLTEACRLVGEALGTSLAKVVELRADGRTLVVRAGVGWKPGVVGTVMVADVQDTSEGHALRTGEPMISPDVAAETRFTYAPFLLENGVRAVANVLIIGAEGRPPFGILQIDSREPRAFTRRDVAFLRSYANLVAAAVDRLRMLKDLRDGEARLRLALDSAELGAWELDLATGAARLSARFGRIFGRVPPPRAWSLESLLADVLPDDRGRARAAFDHAARTGADWHFQCRIRRADDGAVRWIEARGRLHSLPGRQPSHMLGIVVDVSERRQAEETLLRHTEALEAYAATRTRELAAARILLDAGAAERRRTTAALRRSRGMEAVGMLAAGLAHDVHDRLARISGSVEQMRRRAAQERSEDPAPHADAALAAAGHAAELVQRLLAFSRRHAPGPFPTDVGGVVHGMEELLRRTAGDGVRIQTLAVADAWLALCDPDQLETAVLNLVIDGRDAMPAGGTLSIETAHAVVSVIAPGDEAARAGAVPPGEYVVLLVADTGAGRADCAAGLGWPMIDGFARRCGGHARLRSEPGAGTTVAVYLPRSAGPAEAGPATWRDRPLPS